MVCVYACMMQHTVHWINICVLFILTIVHWPQSVCIRAYTQPASQPMMSMTMMMVVNLSKQFGIEREYNRAHEMFVRCTKRLVVYMHDVAFQFTTLSYKTSRNRKCWKLTNCENRSTSFVWENVNIDWKWTESPNRFNLLCWKHFNRIVLHQSINDNDIDDVCGWIKHGNQIGFWDFIP